MLRRLLSQVVPALGSGIAGALIAVVAVRGALPSTATAQQGATGQLRASAFVLVGPDGSVLGQLGAGPEGNGALTLFPAGGTTPNVVIAGTGLITVGTLGPDGSGQIALYVGGASPHGAVTAVSVSDSSGQGHITLGNTEAAYGSAAYGVAAYSSGGQVIATFPTAP